jgi:hypothetical protein
MRVLRKSVLQELKVRARMGHVLVCQALTGCRACVVRAGDVRGAAVPAMGARGAGAHDVPPAPRALPARLLWRLRGPARPNRPALGPLGRPQIRRARPQGERRAHGPWLLVLKPCGFWQSTTGKAFPALVPMAHLLRHDAQGGGRITLALDNTVQVSLSPHDSGGLLGIDKYETACVT